MALGKRNDEQQEMWVATTSGARGKRLQRKRSELVERSLGTCATRAARRSWLCGLEKVQKRYLIAAVARNLGLVMRKVFGIGTARGLQGEGGLVCFALLVCFHIHKFVPRWHHVQLPRRADISACATAA